MSIRGLSPANQTRLVSPRFDVISITSSARHRQSAVGVIRTRITALNVQASGSLANRMAAGSLCPQ